MKQKLLLVSLLVTFFTVTASAQTEKGKFIISGRSSLEGAYLSNRIRGDKISVIDREVFDTDGYTITISPSIGYFVIDNLAVGLSSNISSSTQKAENGDKYNTTAISVAPTVLYFFPVEGKVKPFVQVAAGLNSITEKDMPKSGDDEKYSYSGILLSGGGGVAFFINDNVSFNAGLSYNRTSLTDSDDDKFKIKQGIFAGNVGISVYF